MTVRHKRWLRAVLSTGAAVGLMAGIAAPALADVKAGVDAWAAGDFATAVREWQGPATAGDPDAQFNLAQAYKLGRGVPRDLAKAETLYASAAAKGHLQASDNYGLLLFQRGEHAQAMPYVRAASDRGDARAQYILGLALFNGDGMAKDWVRAYALVSLAQQAGLPQATSALAQMDQHLSMAERQKSVAVAAQIASETEATRVRQVAAADLGSTPGRSAVTDGEPGTMSRRRGPSVATAERAVADAARVAGTSTPASRSAACTAALPCTAPPASSVPARRPAPPVPVPMPDQSRRTAAAAPTSQVSATGAWRLQLGAFGVPGNADALWARIKGRPEVAGHAKLLIATGKLTRLQATGYASQGDASAACTRLKSAGFACLATRD